MSEDICWRSTWERKSSRIQGYQQVQEEEHSPVCLFFCCGDKIIYGAASNCYQFRKMTKKERLDRVRKYDINSHFKRNYEESDDEEEDNQEYDQVEEYDEPSS